MNKSIIASLLVLVIIVIGIAYIATRSTTAPTSTAVSTTAMPQTTIAGTSTVSSKSNVTSTQNSITSSSTIKPSNAQYSVILMQSAAIGNYLANSTGFTLYIYSKDTPNSGNSSCYSTCATNWPPFYSANIVVPSGLNASDFGTITRTGGSKQTTYNGYPLYYFIGDHAAGQTNGQNLVGFKVATT